MNKAVFCVVILVSSIFADTLYLKNGEEIKDAVIVEIGAGEVKYKVGEMGILCTMQKSDIAAILYSDGIREIFSSDFNFDSDSVSSSSLSPYKFEPCHEYDNLSTLLIAASIPLFIFSKSNQTVIPQCERHDDFTLGQRWGTWGINLFLPGIGSALIMKDMSGTFTQWILFGSGIGLAGSGSVELGAIMIIINFTYNIFRSAGYSKPQSVAHNKSEGFNFMVMPNRHGNLLPAVTFNKVF